MEQTKKIIASVEYNEVRVAIFLNNRLDEYYVERKGESGYVGNVYKGRVSAVLPGIQSSFINVGLEKNGFLYVTDAYYGYKQEPVEDEEDFDIEKYKIKVKRPPIEQIIRNGQDILVQIEKDPIESKGVKLSSYIRLPGKFVVLMPNVDFRGVSRRITNKEERIRLKEILKQAKILKDYGCIIRTAGEGKDSKQIIADIKYLIRIWDKICKEAKRKNAPALLHEESDLVIKVVRDHMDEDISEFIIDSKDEYNKIRSFIEATMPELRHRVKFYKNEEPIFEHYKIEPEINNIFKKAVALKCGGYIVIEQTEALVAIDVNTGSHLGKHDFEATVLKTNLEAAEEIPRQLKLRDIGGIIIIDFIDMKSRRNRMEVYNRLNSCLKKDRSKTNILQISKMGLLEMTRQRRGVGLYKTLHEACPYCKSSGYIKSVSSTALDVLRKIRKIFLTNKEKEFIVYLHPSVVTRLLSEDRQALESLEKKFRKYVDLKRDPDSHMQGIRMIEKATKKQIVEELG